MKNITKHKPDKYVMKCHHCDCEFTYELEDLKVNYVTEYVIKCPECETELKHDHREKQTRIKLDLLNNIDSKIEGLVKDIAERLKEERGEAHE